MDKIETPEEFAVNFYCLKPPLVDVDKELLPQFTKLIAVRDAAIRSECAERAVAYCKKWAEFPIGNHGLGALCAAIMAEPKEGV